MTTKNSRPRLRAKPDYVALGPIFPTTLKSMRFAPQGIPKITEWKKRIGNIPLVAIGGIKLEQAAEIFAAGADSIAVVSDVTQNADPDARVRAWLGAERGGRVNERSRDTLTPAVTRERESDRSRRGPRTTRALAAEAGIASARASGGRAARRYRIDRERPQRIKIQRRIP